MKIALLEEVHEGFEDVVQAARTMPTDGCSGNVSVRRGDGDFLITPTAMDYDRMCAKDLVLVHPDGRNFGMHEPSSEWPFHKAIYERYPAEAVGAIVHCHSPAVKVVAAVEGLEELPPAHYELAAVGSPVKITKTFELPGKDLVEQVLEGLAGGYAVILANHGQVALGRDPAHALARAQCVEAAARTFLDATMLAAAMRAVWGDKAYRPKFIRGDKMAQMAEKFKTYGRAKP